MNKTIIININGIVFHIEEDAYEVLRSYMSEVKRHFAYSKDSEEIVTDIENRLAEMFNERLANEGKQVIVLQDVEDIIAQMGSVSDFGINEDEAEYPFEKVNKKLFRDPDDRIIGGVCSGIGYYFNIEARWIRLFMLLLVFFGGSGLMLYAILWIIMPVAETRTDRMAMKGEAINLQNFKKVFDEEIKNVRQGITRVQNGAEPILSSIGNSFITAIKIILKAAGSVLIFMEAMALMGFIVVLVLWNSGNMDHLPRFIDPEYKTIFSIGIFLVVSIPLIALILFEIRLLFNRKVAGKNGVLFMLIVWLAGLGLSTYYGTKVGMQFSEEASFSQVTDIKPMPVYYLKLNSGRSLTKEDSADYNINPNGFKGRRILSISNKGIDYEDNIEMTIERADIGTPVITQEFSSKGADFETALRSAQNITYHFGQVDSVLYFDKTINIGKKALYRDQELKLVLRIPQNTKLIIDRDLSRYIRGYNLWDCIADKGRHKMPSEWIMTENGLKCNSDTLQLQSQD